MSLLPRVLRGIYAMDYDRKYLTGRWFDGPDLTGWRWAWRGLRSMNRVPWPTSPLMTTDANIDFHPDDLNNFQSPGCYFQTGFGGKITIGRGACIGPNVSIITSNHDMHDLNRHAAAEDVLIGERCWIGANSVILPGVKFGPGTIVGAGSVVPKSFPEGNQVIAGNPARVIRELV
jgi:hypothetical protein